MSEQQCGDVVSNWLIRLARGEEVVVAGRHTGTNLIVAIPFFAIALFMCIFIIVGNAKGGGNGDVDMPTLGLASALLFILGTSVAGLLLITYRLSIRLSNGIVIVKERCGRTREMSVKINNVLCTMASPRRITVRQREGHAICFGCGLPPGKIALVGRLFDVLRDQA